MAEDTLELLAICDICILYVMYVQGNGFYIRDLDMKARDERSWSLYKLPLG
jgi:hypothetical protein